MQYKVLAENIRTASVSLAVPVLVGLTGFEPILFSLNPLWHNGSVSLCDMLCDTPCDMHLHTLSTHYNPYSYCFVLWQTLFSTFYDTREVFACA